MGIEKIKKRHLIKKQILVLDRFRNYNYIIIFGGVEFTKFSAKSVEFSGFTAVMVKYL